MHPFRQPLELARLIDNPTAEQLREMARGEEHTTEFGSPCYVSAVRNRSAKKTYLVEDGITLGVDQQGISLEKATALAAEVHRYLADKSVIRLDRQMGLDSAHSYHCRLYITEPYARIPAMWVHSLFAPVDKDKEPDLISIYVPEWPERIIFCHPVAGITYILGTDYFGECKKSFLRMAMFRTKQKGGLGLHAGSKVLRVRDGSGEVKDIGFILFGLSGTGKTTLTIHDHGLNGDERVIIRQDDIVLMDPNGFCAGTEDGFYIKTDGLDKPQKVLYDAAVSPNALFENIKVFEGGVIDFFNQELTSNGRGIVLRKEVAGSDDSIDLQKAHKIIFITRRNDIVPPLARLNPVQGAAYFMLGESIETSAGDPTKAGQSKREVGTNPFIVGFEEEEGHRLLEILRNNPDMECYLLNTGSVGAHEGDEGVKLSIKVSTTLMKEIAHGRIEWTVDPDWGYEVPLSVPGIDIEELMPRHFYSEEEYQARVEKLRNERRQWLSRFPGLAKEVREAVEKA
ncbi:phosphoenolpyruvate carboxykinase [Heliobacterium gestii]|uniref:phosphoenolpyruvate carboxykinase (ATP) n=1 Tax=Heliomicrobium gestii TaxID=2699 RepID=A0A845LFD9_HELGE|nr:phosphoenolpyruvate carboxykinase (ATP) [Heliomicrobium gestii]MBM7866804.1 phosphoenolpyruvate carboxykinase (ATP) [Heliomicrobium gestii]MZP42233.1 phosphoenolpyruvate carboxykinase [Heliomicrobium gestii]